MNNFFKPDWIAVSCLVMSSEYFEQELELIIEFDLCFIFFKQNTAQQNSITIEETKRRSGFLQSIIGKFQRTKGTKLQERQEESESGYSNIHLLAVELK